MYAYDEFGNVVLDSYIGIISPFLDLDQAEDGKEPFFPKLRRTQIDNPYRYAGYEYLDGVKLYDLNARYYDPYTARFLSEDPYYNLGNRIIGLYEINTPNVISIMQANNLFAYCGNNPRYFKDSNGQFWDTIFDVISLAASVVDVIQNHDDPMAWVGLVGDAIDLIPGVTGVGETSRAINTGRKLKNYISGTLGKLKLNSWQDAEKFIRNNFKAKRHKFELSHLGMADRVVDGYNEAKGIIYESKFGRASLSEFIK